MEHLFNSSALRAVDATGCVSLPPFVRATMERRCDSNTVMIGLHDKDPCLRAYDRGYARILHEDHERGSAADSGADGQYARARRTFGFVEEAHYDSSGTITLPAMMRRKGGIGDLALFVGAGGTFEIWDPQLALDSGDETLSELAAWRLEESRPPAN